MSEVRKRADAEYYNLSDRFSSKVDDYSRQFYRIYITRLTKMRDLLLDVIKEKWGTSYPICKLHKLSEEKYDKCIVIGTLFKDQKLKPSVLKQLAEANQLVPQPIISHFTDSSDCLYLEDELQRFILEGSLDKTKLITGIPCALLGSDQGKGKFLVMDFTFVGYRPQIERPLLPEDIYIVFISGLDLVHLENCMLPFKLFVNWISGLIEDKNSINISQVVRLIIAGNSVRTLEEKKVVTYSMTSRVPQSNETIEAVKLLDVLLLELCQVIDVDLMPGENDPSNHILPQKSMHHCMFPNSAIYKSLNRVTNPYECEISGMRLLGSSGQPITDILRFSDITEPIEALENCLKWSHLAPTAPDTLGCFPFYDKDPFIIENCPHVLFAGNQSKFDYKVCTGGKGQCVALVCVPEFHTTFTVCALNLRNLECMPVVFNTF